MPRRTRRDDPQSAAMADASDETSQPVVESLAGQPQHKVTVPQDTEASTEGHSTQEAPAAANARPRSEGARSQRSRRKPTAAAPEAPLESPVTQAVQPDTLSGTVSAGDIDVAPAVPNPQRSRRSRAVRTANPQQKAIASPVSEPASETGLADSSSRRRRIGGRRSPGEAEAAASAKSEDSKAANPPKSIPGLDTDPSASPATDDMPAGAAAPTGGSRRSRRGGRRRRSGAQQPSSPGADSSEGATNPLVDAAAEQESSEFVEPESEDTAIVNAATDEAADVVRKSRRSRRGGRRRGKDEPEVEAAPAASPVPGPKPAPEPPLELTLPPTKLRERWVAPALVPKVNGTHSAQVDLAIEAVVDTNTPAFQINGHNYPAHLFFANTDAATDDPARMETVVREIRRAADAGIHLHTCVTYLPLKNAYGERNFSSVDTAVKAVVEADPEAMIVLRVQCVPTNFWARTHEDQMVRYHDGTAGDVSIASKQFWTDCADALTALLNRLAQPESVGHGHIFALHLDKGEWFYEPGAGNDYSAVNRDAFRDWLHESYQSNYALQAGWHDGGVTFATAEIPVVDAGKEKRSETVLQDRRHDRRFVDYATFASDVVAGVICGLAEVVKHVTSGKLLVFAPYGYLFEFAARNDSGHQSLGRVLKCDAIDVLTGPNSYVSRAAGSVGGFAAPVGSVRLHGKLWIVEEDTKTYLASEETPDTYNPKIASQQETVMVQRRNYFAALAHGCGLAWMDLWGQGWLDSESLWDEIREMLTVGSALREAGGESGVGPEAVALVDEGGYAWVRGDAAGRQLQSGLIAKARDLLVRSGTPVEFFLQSDVATLPDSVKVVFFLNAIRVTTEERQAIRDRLQRPGLTLIWIYAPGYFDENGLAPAEVSEITGMSLRAQPWNSSVGTVFTDARHVVIDRLHGGKRMGTEEALNPSFSVSDDQAAVLGEYGQSGEASIAAHVAESGWKSLYIGEPHLTGELIRGIMRWAGVHLYDIQDDVVYGRGDGLLLIHAPYTGQRVIHLPRPAACYSVFEKRLVTQASSSVRVFMRGRSTHVLLWGDLQTISRRTGVSESDLVASLSARPERDVRDAASERDDPEQRPESEQEDDYATGEQNSEQGLLLEDRVGARLEAVLTVVVDEVYVAPPAWGDSRESLPGGIDARRVEATRITEELLIGIDADTGSDSADPEGDEFEVYDDELSGAPVQVGEVGVSSTGQEPGRRSSRRRRWRRRRSGGAEAGPETASPVSVDDFLGDLAARRKPPEPTS